MDQALTEEADLIGTRLGNYRLECLLGKGRMGVVYLAQDEALLRPTAVKVLSWAFLKNQWDQPEAWFLAEARSVARINHVGVVQVYAVAKHGGYCYIAMEYVDGVSGDALVDGNGPLAPADATQVLLQLANAVGYAHSCNVIHRDIKPANVFIKPDGVAKLGDFGMALHAGTVDEGARAPIGTPHYMAPELWQGSSANPLTDIYALGATYFHFLTGRPPFAAKDLQSLIELHKKAAVPEPRVAGSSGPACCARIVRRCMTKTPSERYQSAQELAWDLRGALRLLHGRPAADVVLEATPTMQAREVSGTCQTAAEPLEPWVTALGLARRPFTGTSPRACPYQGAPFGDLREQLKAFVQSEPGAALILAGAPGSGRTVLARGSLGEIGDRAPAAYIDLKNGNTPIPGGGTLSQWACRALGALPSMSCGHDADLEGLVEHLSTSAEPGLLVVDGVPAESPYVDELRLLIRAASSTKCMNIIAVGDADFSKQVGAGIPQHQEAIRTVEVPALNVEQTTKYVEAWLSEARGSSSLPILFSPDACSLVHHRCEGNLACINKLASNMLRMAAFGNQRVLCSWYAWLAPITDVWTAEMNTDLRKPVLWPTHDVLEILNEYRRQLGIRQRCRT